MKVIEPSCVYRGTAAKLRAVSPYGFGEAEL